jgi:hypothetical protein
MGFFFHSPSFCEALYCKPWQRGLYFKCLIRHISRLRNTNVNRCLVMCDDGLYKFSALIYGRHLGELSNPFVIIDGICPELMLNKFVLVNTL